MKSANPIIPLLFTVIAALLLPACNSGDSDSVFLARMGSIEDARFGGDGWSLDGQQMIATRDKLLDTANFGVNGTVRTSIRITDTAANQGSLSAALLSDFDLFFIGYLNDFSPNAFTQAELDALQTWVSGGGILIVTCDDVDHDAVCEQFGYMPTGPVMPPALPAATQAGHPLFDGPFGVVSEVGMSSPYGSFPQPVVDTVLGVDSTIQPAGAAILIEKTLGLGRVIILGDVDMITGLGGLSVNDAGIHNDNDRFLGNLFAYAIGLIPS